MARCMSVTRRFAGSAAGRVCRDAVCAGGSAGAIACARNIGSADTPTTAKPNHRIYIYSILRVLSGPTFKRRHVNPKGLNYRSKLQESELSHVWWTRLEV